MKVWEGKAVVGFLFTWGLLRSQLQRQNKAKYFSDPLQQYGATSKIGEGIKPVKYYKSNPAWISI